MYTIDKSILEEGVTAQLLQKFIRRHMREIPRINKLERYYRGEHDILKRQKKSDGAPNNKVVCNHAKEITDTATGYFVGNPITYGGDNADTLCEWLKAGDIESVDMEIATDMSKFGRAYELVYMSDDDIAIPKSCVVGTQNAFVVYSDDVTHIPLFGVYYYPIFDADESLVSFRVYLYTPQRCTVYTCDASFGNFSVDADYDNVFGDVPIIEYSNNKEQQGDFEQVIGLIDAYNVLMSDRVNDKEQFVDAILLLVNGTLGDTPEEEEETKRTLRENKILSLPAESDARYLVRTFDESGVEILKKALEQDIHKFANVPCLSDENFAGNSSGVAMEYKMLGIEMIVKIKERFFRKGAKRRIALYDTVNIIKGGVTFGEVELTFTRGLPKNLNDIAQIVTQLQDIVPLESLLPLLPFIKDVDAAIEALKKQKAENMQAQADVFGTVDNSDIGDDNADDTE